MATPLVRVTQKLFGSAGPTGDFGVFGSKANNAQTFSQDPVAIQSLINFLDGWGAAIIGDYEPPLEDMNGLFLVAFRQLAYIFEKGIAEYDPNINYFIGSLVQRNGIIFTSLTDSNINNDPSTDSGVNWQVGIGGQNGGVPTGATLPWTGPINAIPSGYLLGNGAAISRTTYSRLFNVIGVTYGAGDGTTTFNIPDGRGRVLVGTDGTTEFLNPGVVGGAKTHSHTQGSLIVPYIPAASNRGESVPYSTQTFNVDDNSGGNDSDTHRLANVPVTGTTDPASSLMPYLVIGGIIIKI